MTGGLDPYPSLTRLREQYRERTGRELVLDGDPRPLPDAPATTATSRAPRIRSQPEHDQQVALFAWAASVEGRYPELRWLFAVPNWIGTRTEKHGAYLKAEGRKPGVPDVWLPIPRPPYAGCVIEMKVKPNRPTDVQRTWLVALEEAGWRVHVCYDWTAARDALLDYIATPITPLPSAA
jgi:hypothetical protein